MNYYKNKEDAFTSSDLFVDSPFVLKILPNRNFRESIKQYLRSNNFHENIHFKDVYDQMEQYRIDENFANQDKVEERNATEVLPLTYDQLIDMTENKLTDEDEIIANRLYHYTCHLRNDFHSILIADSAMVEYLGDNPNHLNFLDMENSKLHITPVKTGKVYEEIVYDVDEKTMQIIHESLCKKPRKFLFCSARDRHLPLNTTDMSKLLRDPIKRIFNVDLEIRHLRAIHETYANREYENGVKVLTNKERDKFARHKMAHTKNTAEKTYVRRKSIPIEKDAINL